MRVTRGLPIATRSASSGGGSSAPDYTGELIALSEYAGSGFGDGLTHYDATEDATWDGTTLEIAQGSIVAITIPEAVRAGVVGFMLSCQYGTTAPDSNDFMYAWLQLAAGTAVLNGAGIMSSIRYRAAITMTGNATTPVPSSTSSSSAHGLVQAANDTFDVGTTLSAGTSLTTHSNASIYAATGVTAPGNIATQTFTGWRAQDSEPSPERVCVWLPDLSGPVAGATVKFTHLQLVRRRTGWSL